jgi:outer membrane receptor protein involved in Fe transport
MVQYGANAATLSRDTAVTDSPAGGVAMKMAVTGNDPYTATYNSTTFNIATAASGQTWTLSVYVKASVATTGELFIFGAGLRWNNYRLSVLEQLVLELVDSSKLYFSFTMLV